MLAGKPQGIAFGADQLLKRNGAILFNGTTVVRNAAVPEPPLQTAANEPLMNRENLGGLVCGPIRRVEHADGILFRAAIERGNNLAVLVHRFIERGI